MAVLPGSKLVRLRKSELLSHDARCGFRLNYCSVRDRDSWSWKGRSLNSVFEAVAVDDRNVEWFILTHALDLTWWWIGSFTRGMWGYHVPPPSFPNRLQTSNQQFLLFRQKKYSQNCAWSKLCCRVRKYARTLSGLISKKPRTLEYLSSNQRCRISASDIWISASDISLKNHSMFF